MAISGQLLADFASFYAACEKAQVSLRSFEAGSSKVESALSRMTDTFSGRKLIQEATLMSEVFQRAGGAVAFTTEELQRMGTVGTAAIEKMRVTGMAIPPQLYAMADAAKRVETNMAGLQAQLSTVGAAAVGLGAGLTAGVTAPLVAMGGLSVKAAMDFETAFSGVRKTVSGTPADLDAINAQFRQMATITPLTAVGLAKIGEMAGQLGVKRDTISAFTKTIADVSVATNLTADEAGAAFARLANVMKMPQSEFSNLGSAVVALGNFGASTEQEMLDMGQRISAAGATANMTAPQVLGIANALSSVGINAEAGGTAISKAINQMSTAVASGGGKLEIFAQVAGMSAERFRKAWRDDAGTAFASFMSGLAKARDQGGETLIALMDDLGFTEVRLRNAFLAAANAGSLMTDSIRLGSRAFEENTELVRASGERYKTTENQLKILTGNLNEAAITLGNAFNPGVLKAKEVLLPLVQGLAELARGFADLPGWVQGTAVALGAAAASVGPLLVAFGGLAFTANQVNLLFTAFPVLGVAASTVMTTLTTGVTGMIATAAGVIALGAAVGTLAYGFTRLADIVSGGKLSAWLTPFLAGTAELKLKTEEAAAGADVLALATARSGHAVTSMSEAMAINTKFVKDHNEQAAKAAALEQAFVGPIDQVANATTTLAEKVANLTHQQREDIKAKMAQLEPTKAIAHELGIAEEVVAMYERQVRAAAKAQAELTKEEDRASVATDQLTELWSKAIESRAALDKKALTQSEAALADRMALELAYDKTRVENGTMTEEAYLQTKSTLEYQYLQRHLGVLKESLKLDLEANGAKLDAELAKIDLRYAKGLITQDEYEAQYAAVEQHYANLRNGIQDDYYAKAASARTKALTKSEEDHRKSATAVAASWGIQFTQMMQGGNLVAESIGQAAVAMGKGFDDTKIKVRMLNGEIVSLKEALDRFNAGGVFDVTIGNFAQTLTSLGLGGGEELAREGYSFQEIVAILRGGRKGKPVGPRIPGYSGGVEDAPGGWSMVGEDGPEPMYVPPHASILKSGSAFGAGVTRVTVNMRVSGVWDLRSKNELTTVVKAGIVEAFANQGERF